MLLPWLVILCSLWLLANAALCSVSGERRTRFDSGTSNAEQCTELRYLGLGAKNIVFHCRDGRADEVRRMSFSARFTKSRPDGSEEVRDTVSACAVDTNAPLTAIRTMLSRCYHTDTCPRNENALRDALFIVGQRQEQHPAGMLMDLVSNITWQEEQFPTSRAADAGLAMGVNVPLSAVQIRVPLCDVLRCDNKTAEGELEADTVYMTVERQRKHDGSVNGDGSSEDDIFEPRVASLERAVEDMNAKIKQHDAQIEELFAKNKALFANNKDLFAKNKALFANNKDLFAKNKALFAKHKERYRRLEELRAFVNRVSMNASVQFHFGANS